MPAVAPAAAAANRSRSPRRTALAAAASRAARALFAPRSAAPSHPAPALAVERLEDRALFTVITGSPAPSVTTFDFIDATGQAVRVDVQGNIRVELIGSNLDAQGNVGLNNLPGNVNVRNENSTSSTVSGTGTGRRLFGGRGGEKGVFPVTALNANANPPTVTAGAGPARTPITDIASIPDPLGGTDPQFANRRVGGSDGLGNFGAPSADVNINAIASNGAGQTFGFNVATVQAGNAQRIIVQLVEIDNATGAATVVEDLNRDATPIQDSTNPNDLNRFGGYLFGPVSGTTTPAQVAPSIAAADFLPTDDTKLYFVATVQVQTSPTAATTAPQLFVYDFTAPIGHRVRLISGAFGSFSGGGAQAQVSTVSGISFDPNTNNLWVYATVPNNQATPGPALYNLGNNPTSTNIGFGSNGTEVDGITGAVQGIEFLGSGPGDINNDPNGIYVLTDDTLFRVDISQTLNNGNFGSVALGPLPDPDDNATPPRGSNMAGITYNPTLLNPFFLNEDPASRRRGVFLGTDTTTDELLFIDFRNRFPTSNLFALYVTLNDPNGSTTDGKISITSGTVDAQTNLFTYTPFAGSVTFDSGFVTPDNTVTLGGGDVLIGALNGNDNPVNSANAPTPNTFTLLPGLTSVAPGLITGPNVNLDTFLLSGTITGQVYIANSINSFVTGSLATGNASGGVLPTFNSLNNGFFGPNFGFFLDDNANNNPANFYVGGDLRDLIVTDQAGIVGDAFLPDANFFTRLHVGGRTGNIRVGGESGIRGVFEGQDRAQGMPGFIMQREIEEVGGARNFVREFQRFRLSAIDPGVPGLFSNDTPDNAQYLGTINSNAFGPQVQSRQNVIQLRGKMEPGNVGAGSDPLDHYAIGLMAGQVYSFQLLGMVDNGSTDVTTWTYSGILGAALSLVDPDGRVVATNLSNIDSASTQGAIFSYRADRPGIYTLIVNSAGGSFPYELTAFNVGKTALGAYRAGAIGDPRASINRAILVNTTLATDTAGIQLGQGDIGILHSDSEIVSGTNNFLNVTDGNIRTILAQNIGRILVTPIPEELRLGQFGDGIDIYAPNGSVGLIRQTDAAQTGILSLNRNLRLETADAVVLFTEQAFGVAIGGDYQQIDAAGGFFGNVLANGNIGVVRVGDMAFLGGNSTFSANHDGQGPGGVIDMIETHGSGRSPTGQFGTLSSGGPILSTGPGGNVRYIVPASDNIFRDPFFGTGGPEITTFTPGVAANLVDDSGSVLTATPGPLEPNPGFNQTLPEDPVTNPRFINLGQITAITYPVRGSGGSVIVRLTSTRGMDLVSSAGRANQPSVEVSRVEVSAAASGHSVVAVPVDRLGRPVFGIAGIPVTNALYGTGGASTVGTLADGTLATAVATAILLRPGGANVLPGLPPGTPGTTTGTSVTMTGNANIDVFNLVQNDAPNIALDFITNETGGELVNAALVDVGTIQYRGNIGMGRSATGTYVRATAHPGGLPTGLFPLDPGQPTGIYASGNIATVRTARAIGNLAVGVFAGNDIAARTTVLGNIGEISANFGGDNNAQTFEGFAGNVFTSGRINLINLGEGLAPTGTGNISFAGIYALGEIGTVTNTNARGDVRGTIASTTGIIEIVLRNASFVNADILTPADLDSANPLAAGFIFAPVGGTFDEPVFQIGRISVTGDGGIIGSRFYASGIGPVDVSRFIFNSEFQQAGSGVQADITVGGYGIRAVAVQAFNLSSFVASGNGGQLSTNDVSPSVRRSEGDLLNVGGNQLDPFFLSEPTRLTDIHAFLGTSSAVPVIPNVTNTGVIEDVDVRIARDLGRIRAWQVRGSQPAAVRDPSSPIQIFPTSGAASVFTVGNTLGTFETSSVVNGLQLTAGSIKTFKPGSDVLNASITVSSQIKTLTINGSLANNSSIRTVGPNSTIGKIDIKRNLDGRIETRGRINTITIGGNLNGAIVINATNFGRGNALNKLTLNGLAVTGSLQITGNVGSITTAGSLGQSGDNIAITGNLSSLTVGTRTKGNAVLAANVSVAGNLGKVKVNGRVTGSFTVRGNLNSLDVAASPAFRNSDIFTNTLRVDGTLNSAKFTNGNLASPSFSAFRINKLALNRGNLAPNSSVSADSALNSFTVKGGSILGSVSAGGNIGTLSADGNLGNGVNPLTVTAPNLNKLKIGGSVFSQVTVTVPGTIGELSIGGELQQGATITAGAIGRLRIGGARNGTINVG